MQKPILVHAILETALGVANLEEIAYASPRMQGMSFGPADLAASRRMKTTRVGGGHPGYVSMSDPRARRRRRHRRGADPRDGPAGPVALLDRAHGGRVRERRDPPVLRAVRRHQDVAACEAQFRSAFLLGCVGAWSLHPVQIDIAKKVFSPDPDEVKFAKKVIEAIPDGRGVHMIDGKMQDDATWKQCQVMVQLATMLAEKDPELKEAYGF